MATGKNNLKKVRLFIFEGKSDLISLGRYLEQALNDEETEVRCRHTHGDITSDWNTNYLNLFDKVSAAVDACKYQYKLDYENFAEIVQICDTDGAYVLNKRVVSDEYEHPFLDVENKVIRTNNRKYTINRNWNKCDLLDRLIDCGSIKGIPYRILFFSGNLEHVLHNKPNILGTKEEINAEKTRLSNLFALRFEHDLPGFIDFILESPFSINTSYDESWDFIRDDRFDARSLERYTNFGLALTEKKPNAKSR